MRSQIIAGPENASKGSSSGPLTADRHAWKTLTVAQRLPCVREILDLRTFHVDPDRMNSSEMKWGMLRETRRQDPFKRQNRRTGGAKQLQNDGPHSTGAAMRYSDLPVQSLSGGRFEVHTNSELALQADQDILIRWTAWRSSRPMWTKAAASAATPAVKGVGSPVRKRLSCSPSSAAMSRSRWRIRSPLWTNRLSTSSTTGT